ncbi:MAG: hypothetical protein H0S78_04610 [Tissierellales bacterium]|nr:hypothetical protein [Tissierellales bacterium]
MTQVPELADVPTTVEKGVDFTQGSWRGYAVKKGTPQPIVDYLENMLKEVYESPEYREIAENEKSDLIPGYLNAEETQEMWLSELERFKKVFGE